jgi:hypothetical protein
MAMVRKVKSVSCTALDLELRIFATLVLPDVSVAQMLVVLLLAQLELIKRKVKVVFPPTNPAPFTGIPQTDVQKCHMGIIQCCCR